MFLSHNVVCGRGDLTDNGVSQGERDSVSGFGFGIGIVHLRFTIGPLGDNDLCSSRYLVGVTVYLRLRSIPASSGRRERPLVLVSVTSPIFSSRPLRYFLTSTRPSFFTIIVI